MNIQGRIKAIGQVQNISSSFRKIEFVITTEEQYPQDILIECTQDRVNLLDGMQVGTLVKVDINLKGREWISPQGEVRYFNTIQAWRITAATHDPQMHNGAYYGQGSAVDAHNQYRQNQSAQGNNYASQPQQSSPPTFTQEDQDDLPF